MVALSQPASTSTKTTSVAIRYVYAYQDIFKQETLQEKQKIKFLSGLALHNDETLKREGNPFKSLILVLPMHQLDKDIQDKYDDSKCIDL
ncbi:MAG: hypothetical protein AAGA80_13145 [Cyanobacteria bacterium P01_F01_bin.143]